MNVPLLRDPEPGDLLKQVRLLGQPVSGEAFDLLRERRRIRRRGTMWSLPAIVALVLIVVVWVRSGAGQNDIAYYLTLGVVVTLSMYARHEIIRRAERRLSALLPRRVSRTEAVTIRTVLGRPTIRALGAALVVQVAILVVLVGEGRTTAAIAFTVICAAAWVLSAGAVLHVTNRPVLAVDPLTLAVDDRLRTNDAFVSCRLALLAGLTGDLLVDRASAVGPWVPLIVLVPILLDSRDGESRRGRYPGGHHSITTRPRPRRGRP